MLKIISWIKELGKRNILVSVVIILLIIDFLLVKNVTLGQVKDLTGQIKTVPEVEKSALKTLFFGIPFISVLIGSIVGIFLSKEKSYNFRFIKSSLITLIVLYSIIMIVGIRNIILW